MSAAQVIPDTLVGDYRDLEMLRKVTSGAQVVTFDHEHVPTEHLHALARRRGRHPARARGAGPRPGQGGDAGPARRARRPVPAQRRRHRRVATSRRSASRASSRPTRGGYDGKGVWFVETADDCAEAFATAARTGVPLLAEERVDFRRELSALVARSPSGQAAAYPVVASTQLDGICHEVVAPGARPRPDAGDAGPAGRADHRQGARRDRRAGRRAVRDHATAGSWSTSWRCARTTPATGRRTAR